MVSVDKRAKNRMLALNDRGYVIGEQHHRAKLSDHDIELILSLIEARDALVREYTAVGLGRRQIQDVLTRAQLSERWIAEKFEVSRRTVRDIRGGRIRGQMPTNWRSTHSEDVSRVTAKSCGCSAAGGWQRAERAKRAVEGMEPEDGAGG